MAFCPLVDDPQEIQERYADLLHDESRLSATNVKTLFFPHSEEELAGALATIQSRGERCVLSGGRTGITGAAVPLEADSVITFRRMNRILALGEDEEGPYLRAQPGVTLKEIEAFLSHPSFPSLFERTSGEQTFTRAYLEKKISPLWFPVDPTEKTAQLGGAVANNASGSRSYRHGSIRRWIRGLRTILPDGRRLGVHRGSIRALDRVFHLRKKDGTDLAFQIPYAAKPHTKHTLGYPTDPETDLIDLFVGSEGTLVAFSEIILRLALRPPAFFGLVALLPEESQALDLIEAAESSSLTFEAIEYFDPASLALLHRRKEEEGAGSILPDLPCWNAAAVYLEIMGTEEEISEACDHIPSLVSKVGGSVDATWAATEWSEEEAMKAFRHAVPETVNLWIRRRQREVPGLHKVGTDMAVPRSERRRVMEMYRDGLRREGLESVLFGHLGDAHAHVNILPRDLDELRRAKALYQAWAREIVAMGGAVAAEHGIGRLKKELLAIQYPPPILETMRTIRRAFDPQGTLAPGVLV